MADSNPQSGLEVSVSTTTFRQKYRIVQIKIQAEKQLFELSDLLGKHGGIPTVSSFLEEEIRKVMARFFERAQTVLGHAIKADAQLLTEKKN